MLGHSRYNRRLHRFSGMFQTFFERLFLFCIMMLSLSDAVRDGDGS